MNRLRGDLERPLVIELWALAAGAAVLFDVAGWFRAPVVLSFIVVCPGLAITGMLRFGDWLEELGVACAISLGLAGVVSVAMSYAGVWSPNSALAVLLGVATAGSFVELRTRLHAPTAPVEG